MSAALARALTELGVKVLRDAHGISVHDLRRNRVGGAVLFSELVRLVNLLRRHSPPAVALPANEWIGIPEEVRDWNVAGLSISTRLRHMLQTHGYDVLGKLEGVPYAQFRKYRNCGRLTIDELRSVIAQLNGGESPYDANRARAVKVVQHEECFLVPPEAQSLLVTELPFSARALAIFKRQGIKTLSDLHCVPIRCLSGLRGLGLKSLKAISRVLERAAAGEFQVTQTHFHPSQAGTILKQLDNLLAGLPKRNQRILKLWLTGDRGRLLHLQEIGSRFTLTRERVRQIVIKALERIRKEGGPPLAARLSQMILYCRRREFSPALMQDWLREVDFVPAHDCQFYVALIGKLCPEITTRSK